MSSDADALVIGGGPAGTSTAILLASVGWRVLLIEQQRFPRQKVCGECVGAGYMGVLDKLGVGAEFRQRAGPELRQVGWMSAAGTVIADMPACTVGPYRYGRAVGRDSLDTLLLQRARSVGVGVIQPARVRRIAGMPGDFECEYELSVPRASAGPEVARRLRVPIVVDAHGSWEGGAKLYADGSAKQRRAPRLGEDLLAFKASFRDTSLPAGLLPVIAVNGGYGGMVVADDGRTTLACCIRRDVLQKCRRLAPGQPAGNAIEAYLRSSCRGISYFLQDAHRDGPWLSVAPVRPGVKLHPPEGPLRVGNAAGETHPLVGEGIGMALRSATLLVHHLTRRTVGVVDTRCLPDVHREYASAWRAEFGPRLRFAEVFARIAMNPALAAAAGAMLTRSPLLLTLAARLAGKARASVFPGSLAKGLA